MLTRRHFNRLALLGLGAGLANCTASPRLHSLPVSTAAPNDADLVIWWEQGYLPEENAGLTTLVRQWEEAAGLKVDLKLMEIATLQKELLTAIAHPEQLRVPDVVFAVPLDANLAPRLAWQNQLTDLTDLFSRYQHLYSPDVVSQVTYRNQVVNERRIYAMPIASAGEYIHCWQNRLSQLGVTPQAIPQRWDEFWQFWRQAQPPLRAQGDTNLFSIGLCMSAIGVDAFTSLRWFLDAHGATVVSDNGTFVLSTPSNRQQLIAALQEYTGFYQAGFVPPDATGWTASGNNARFLEGALLMTHNPTLSIPSTQKLEPNPYNQDATERYQQIVTLGWPQKLNGEAYYPRKSIKQVILPKAGNHPAAAQDFMAYLIQPEHLNQLLIEGFKGRFLPVMPQLLTAPYWQNPDDLHLQTALAMQQQPSPIPYETLNPAYSQILGQQVWGQTILRVVKDRATPEAAADWAIATISDIWHHWENIA